MPVDSSVGGVQPSNSVPSLSPISKKAMAIDIAILIIGGLGAYLFYTNPFQLSLALRVGVSVAAVTTYALALYLLFGKEKVKAPEFSHEKFMELLKGKNPRAIEKYIASFAIEKYIASIKDFNSEEALSLLMMTHYFEDEKVKKSATLLLIDSYFRTLEIHEEGVLDIIQTSSKSTNSNPEKASKVPSNSSNLEYITDRFKIILSKLFEKGFSETSPDLQAEIGNEILMSIDRYADQLYLKYTSDPTQYAPLVKTIYEMVANQFNFQDESVQKSLKEMHELKGLNFVMHDRNMASNIVKEVSQPMHLFLFLMSHDKESYQYRLIMERMDKENFKVVLSLLTKEQRRDFFDSLTKEIGWIQERLTDRAFSDSHQTLFTIYQLIGDNERDKYFSGLEIEYATYERMGFSKTVPRWKKKSDPNQPSTSQ